MLCLGASMVFWLFNALNKEHTADLEYPVRIRYDAERSIPVGDMPQRVGLNVTGKGWNLLAATLGIRMDPVMLSPSNEIGVTRISRDELLREFSPVLGKLKINYFRNDHIEFSLDTRLRKKVALVADLSGLTMLPGHEPIAPITVRPDSVVIDGPASLVASVPDPLSVRPSEDRVSGEYRRAVLINAGKGIKTRPMKAEIGFLTIKMETVVRKVPLLVAPGSSRWKADTDSVQVTFRMRADQVIPFRSFEPVAMVKPVSRARSQRCRPQLDTVPAGVRVVGIDSVTLNRK